MFTGQRHHCSRVLVVLVFTNCLLGISMICVTSNSHYDIVGNLNWPGSSSCIRCTIAIVYCIDCLMSSSDAIQLAPIAFQCLLMVLAVINTAGTSLIGYSGAECNCAGSSQTCFTLLIKISAQFLVNILPCSALLLKKLSHSNSLSQKQCPFRDLGQVLNH